MCCCLTEELQSCISHGPAGRTEQSERQDGYSRSKREHSTSQTWTADQGLQSVDCTHLERQGEACDHICACTSTLLSSQLWLWGKTCGRSSVGSQLSGRGLLAVSSNVCILWDNSDLVLLVSLAEQTHRMSIGNPAARRVTDVKRGNCTTFNPYRATDLQL